MDDDKKEISLCDHNNFQERGGSGSLMSFWKEWHILKLSIKGAIF